jgi:hypothetical protein
LVGVVLGRDPLLFGTFFPFITLSTSTFCAFVGVESDDPVEDRFRILLSDHIPPHELSTARKPCRTLQILWILSPPFFAIDLLEALVAALRTSQAPEQECCSPARCPSRGSGALKMASARNQEERWREGQSVDGRWSGNYPSDST